MGADHRPLILRMKDVHQVDSSGMATLEGIIEHRQKAGGRLILTALQPGVRTALEKYGILDRVGRENVFEHTRCAIASIDAPAQEAAGVARVACPAPAEGEPARSRGPLSA